MALSRRTFIKTGIIGGGLLAIAGLASKDTVWGGGTTHQTPTGEPLKFLTRKDYQVLATIASILLSGAISQEPESRKQQIDTTLRELDKALIVLQPTAQKELRQLLGLLKIPITRILAARVTSSWENASPEAINSFLMRWRNSNTALFRTAYSGLHQLIMGAWYGQEQAWSSIGYPGPPLQKILTGAHR